MPAERVHKPQSSPDKPGRVIGPNTPESRFLASVERRCNQIRDLTNTLAGAGFILCATWGLCDVAGHLTAGDRIANFVMLGAALLGVGGYGVFMLHRGVNGLR